MSNQEVQQEAFQKKVENPKVEKNHQDNSCFLSQEALQKYEDDYQKGKQEEDNKNQDDNQKEKKCCEKLENCLQKLCEIISQFFCSPPIPIKFILYYVFLLFFPIFQIVYGCIKIYQGFKEQKIYKYKYILINLLCIFVLYCPLSLIDSENKIIIYLQVDGIIFYSQLIFVFTFLVMNYQSKYSEKCKYLFHEYSFSTFQYLSEVQCDRYAYFLDFDLLPKLTKPNTQKVAPDPNQQKSESQKNQNQNQQIEQQVQDQIQNNIQKKQDAEQKQGNEIDEEKTKLNNKTEANDDNKQITQSQNPSQFESIEQKNQDEQDEKLKQEYDFAQVMEKQKYQKISLQFSYLGDKVKDISKPQSSVNDFFEQFRNYIKPRMKCFVLLLLVLILKISFCLYYIFLNINELKIKEYFDVFIIIFLYLYNAFNLNRILGNKDLRRKYAFMKKQQTFIDFRNTKDLEKNLKKKLDVTCPISLEAWDNARKFMLGYQEEWLHTIEWSYACLFLCYIFVTLVDLSYYFELYWIFSSDSILLHPIMVIMSSFNFHFLTVLFLFRLYEGNRFNDSFEDLDDDLDYLIDVMEDLQTMFDVHFNNKEKGENSKIDINSVYGIIIKQIKYKSFKYIKKIDGADQVEFENKIYQDNKEDKFQLRKKLLQNTKQSLKKVKRSLTHDANKHKYKFFNIIELRFKDTFFTLLVAFLTILPTVIPRFKQFFESKPN